MKYIKSLLFCYFLIFTCVVTLPGKGQAGDVTAVNVGLHQSEFVSLPRGMTHVIIADRGVAGVVKHDAERISVVGHGIGKTNIRVMNGDKIVRQINVTVSQDLPSIRKTLSTLFPSEQIGVETVNSTIALTGGVSDNETAAQIVRVVQEYVGQDTKILNLMRMKTGQQVMLRVRVGEVRRDALNKLGLGLHGVISAGSAVLGALERDGVFKVLAEPTLTAISGETANFLAGGEFPVPIAQPGNTMSVEYKPFGVRVDFTPRVLSENRIRLDVGSEVSEIQDIGQANVRSMVVPAISTRRANTTVELASGESFMIAGLIQDKSKANIHKVPGLGDIPILSPLFRSAEFQRNETELVIAVTPYLADPVSGSDIRLPTDNYQDSSMMEKLFLGNMGSYKDGNAADANKRGPEGSVGYLTD